MPLDYSKNRVTDETMRLLLELAVEQMPNVYTQQLAIAQKSKTVRHS